MLAPGGAGGVDALGVRAMTTAEIQLSGRLGLGLVTLVDREDVDRLSELASSWHIGSKGYVLGAGKRLMHRLILGAPAGLTVDHISGDKLDNRKVNLRLASWRENIRNRGASAANKSGFKGVSWHSGNRKWCAQIRIGPTGAKTFLGLFETKEEAAIAYNLAAIQHHGEFAYLNIVSTGTST